MSAKLTPKERQQIILDHLSGIPNRQYEVKELSNGTYRVSKIESEESPSKPESIEPEQPKPTAVTRPLHAEGSSAHQSPSGRKRPVITNEDIMMKLTELYESQNRVPQRPPPESSTPRPPIDSTVEEETVNALMAPIQTKQTVPMRPTTGRRRLVLH